MGVQSIILTKDNKYIICGTGSGQIALLNTNNLTIVRKLHFGQQKNKKNNKNNQKRNGTNINPAITSLALNAAGDHFFVGTSKSTMYLVAIDNFDYELRNSAHYNRINDIAFPYNYSDLFVTAGTYK